MLLLLIIVSGVICFRSPNRFLGLRTQYFLAKSQFVLQMNSIQTVHFDKIDRISIDSNTDNPTDKIPLLYIPGFDGVGNYSRNAILTLSDKFDSWKMTVDGSDRSTFIQLADKIINHLKTYKQPVVLMGESFGGVLSLYVSLKAPKYISKLILVNPATSYGRSVWPLQGPIIAATGPAFPVVGLLSLMTTALDKNQLVKIGLKWIEKINSTDTLNNELNRLLASATALTEAIPPEAVRWRLREWLQIGNYLIEDKISHLKVPTLLLISAADRLLPSKSEGRKLKKLLTKSVDVELVEFLDRGHALLDTSFDLLKVMKSSRLFKDIYGSLQMALPSTDTMDQFDKQAGLFLNLTSPIFLSTNPAGEITLGLDHVPIGSSGRPVLLVGNHQLYGADMSIIIRQFITEKKTLIRGLAHPVLFSEEIQPTIFDINLEEQGMKGFLTKFGAVEVSPMSIFQLLRQNETVLLFPGGAREATHGENEKYKLFWPSKNDFVRMAAVTDAIIVPFAAIGSADSVKFLMENEELQKIPFMKDSASSPFGNVTIPNARPGVNDTFQGPLVVPSLPSRHYFLFQKPIDTRSMQLTSKSESRKVYEMIKQSVNDGLEALQIFRQDDPYRDFLPRILYERLNGVQAPTAPLSSLAVQLESLSQRNNNISLNEELQMI